MNKPITISTKEELKAYIESLPKDELIDWILKDENLIDALIKQKSTPIKDVCSI